MAATIHFFMVRAKGIGMLVMALFLGLFMVACTPPTKPASLQSAEAAVEQVQSDPSVTRYAPVKLDKARETLQEAQTAWEKSKSLDEVAHRAYLAQQRARIAAVAAEGKEAQTQIKDLSEKREQMLLEAQQFEAQQARERAEAAKAQAEQARKQAEMAEARAKQAREQAEAAETRNEQMKQQLSELQAKKTKRGHVITLGNILFEVDKAELTSEAMQGLSRLVNFLKDFPEREVVIEGYTDSTGSEAYNLDLSQRRAGAVRRFLVDNGIAPERIVARGYGEAYPVAPNDTAAGRARNRRVDIVILNEGEKAKEYQRPR